MGLFRSRKKKNKNNNAETASLQVKTRKSSISKKKEQWSEPAPATHYSLKEQRSDDSKEPTMDLISCYIEDLATSNDTSSEAPALALRNLFALSEHGNTENRSMMVRVDEGSLVPCLLQFLERCEPGSSEQYLTLLVLNNISIPSENKRLIGLVHGGAQILARLLCRDPSCHLMAIILVNLTFSDADLRREIVASKSGGNLVEALSFALRVASLSPEEFELSQGIINCSDKTPKDILVDLAFLDARKSSSLNNPDLPALKSESDIPCYVYPETVRWCLSALKNLTRPSKDSISGACMVNSGVVPLILKFLTISGAGPSQATPTYHSGSLSASESPTAAEPVEEFTNPPSTWDSNSIPDAALFVVMNLAASQPSREHLLESDALSVLCFVTEFQNIVGENRSFTEEEKQIVDFQRIKARMALSLLIGSEGNFGQPRLRSSSSVYTSPDDAILILDEIEINILIELLANAIHCRAKDGPGGYSAATFSAKQVLFSIRCLLTNNLNQIRVANLAGPRLNSLLMKAIGKYSLQNNSSMDPEAAEHACFSLYLQSNYGFTAPFLPSFFSDLDLPAKVFSTYLNMSVVTPAGKHAAEQLLLRMKYLQFDGETSEFVDGNSTLCGGDFIFDQSMLAEAEMIIVDDRPCGAKPREDIFDRPILRSRAPRKGDEGAPWDKPSSVSVFPSALMAVQQLSYASSKVRHIDAIDDILIANNVANSANGVKTESYNYWWSWQDTAGEIQKNLERQRSGETEGGKLFSVMSDRFGQAEDGEPISIFGLRCGPSICSSDTTY